MRAADLTGHHDLPLIVNTSVSGRLFHFVDYIHRHGAFFASILKPSCSVMAVKMDGPLSPPSVCAVFDVALSGVQFSLMSYVPVRPVSSLTGRPRISERSAASDVMVNPVAIRDLPPLILSDIGALDGVSLEPLFETVSE